jgi:regulator of sigma E protease
LELFSSIGLSLVAFVFVLGVLIFIHELGHYLVAKALGIRVEVFSLGFGPRLAGFRRGHTDYRLSAVPLGGYVKMLGENPDEGLSGSPEEFLSRPKLHRFAVVIAGPLMNLILAVVLVAGSFFAGTEMLAYLNEEPVVGGVRSESPAATAGFEIGDKILSIDGEEVSSWAEVEFKIKTSPDILLILEVDSKGRQVRREVIPETAGTGAGYVGIGPFIPYRVEMVDAGSAAEDADLRAGDVIRTVSTAEGEFEGFFMIAEAVSRSEIEPLLFKLERDGELLEKSITPRLAEGRPRIGAWVEFETVRQEYGVFAALTKSVEENYRWTALTFTTVGRIIRGEASVKQLSGPIEIARFSGRAASLGWMPLLMFMALISLQLGILNLLPIPILDGGVIALMMVEGVLGRELSVQVKARIFQVGFIFLIVLMGVVIFNDITKNLPDF